MTEPGRCSRAERTARLRGLAGDGARQRRGGRSRDVVGSQPADQPVTIGSGDPVACDSRDGQGEADARVASEHELCVGQFGLRFGPGKPVQELAAVECAHPSATAPGFGGIAGRESERDVFEVSGVSDDSDQEREPADRWPVTVVAVMVGRSRHWNVRRVGVRRGFHLGLVSRSWIIGKGEGGPVPRGRGRLGAEPGLLGLCCSGNAG